MTFAQKAHATGWSGVWVALGLLLVSGLAWFLDDRTLHGVSVWAKPMKFNLSFALHLATVLLFVRLLTPVARASALLAWSLTFMAAATVVELGYIFLQAARGRASHFNFETAWEQVFYYRVMGGSALIVIAATIVVGVLVWRHGDPRFGPGLRNGAALGAIVGALATLVTAGALASNAVTDTGHWVGGLLSDAEGLPVFGWSTSGGDLRVPHFFATHLVQALPLLGWGVDRLRLPKPRSTVTIGLLAGLFVTFATFAQAISGSPLLPSSFAFSRSALP